MLHEIRIQGLGVIADAVLTVHPGLTVLSGETGAGKTMVVQGLGLLLGARADAGQVRTGHTGAVVEGLVSVPEGHPARARALEAGALLDDDVLVLARSVSVEGRSRAVVGGRTAPAGVLGELGEVLVALHGQADQWRLRRPDQHREVIDAFGGAPLAATHAAYQQAYAAWTAARAEQERLRGLDRDRTREIDSLTAALEQIERVDPAPGEDLALRGEHERLAHGEGLRRAADLAHRALAGADDDDAQGQVIDLVATARAVLSAEADHDRRLGELAERMAELGYLAADLAADLSGYLADLELDPARLDWVQQRRADLGALTRRYGDTVDDVLAWARTSAARVAELVGADDRLAALEDQVPLLTAAVHQQAARLTEQRRRAATGFAEQVTAELRELAMGSARVQVALTERPPGPHGCDEIELQLQANSGAAPRSIAKAASGGELSRLMLAIEVVSGASAGSAHPPTFVFDEVDAGIGGQAALAVGARLARLAEHAQVIVVTHLAQVAAHADAHLVVRKADDGTITASTLTQVTGEDQLRELARMMGGDVSPAGLAHAQHLLDSARRARRAEPRARGQRRRSAMA